MALSQFFNSISRIARNRHINRPQALARHLAWQVRKVANRFPVELPLAGSVIIAEHRRCGVSALVNAHGMYDYNNMTLIQLLLERGGCFVDVGANVGAFSLVASEQRSARVLAFEPHPVTFAALRSNIDRNRRDNVELVCAAVGRDEGSVTITNTPGSSTTHIATTADRETITVPMVRLDLELAARAIAPLIVKIDVEGFELDVLTGLGAALTGVTVILVEMNGLGQARGGGEQAIIDVLENAGFIGPLYYKSRNRRLVVAPELAGEDAIFVARGRVDALAANFGIALSAQCE